MNLYELEYNKTIRNIVNLPLSTSKINLRIIFNDITIGEHELLARIKVFICWLSENENEITHIIL